MDCSESQNGRSQEDKSGKGVGPCRRIRRVLYFVRRTPDLLLKRTKWLIFVDPVDHANAAGGRPGTVRDRGQLSCGYTRVDIEHGGAVEPAALREYGAGEVRDILLRRL